METDGLRNLVSTLCNEVAQLPCWHAQQGYGSYLTLEFGQPHLSTIFSRDPHKRKVTPQGEFELFIQCCYWTIEREGTLLAHCESSRPKIATALRAIDSKLLCNVVIDCISGNTDFEFEHDATLKTFPYEHLSREGTVFDSWHWFAPENRVLTYSADGTYRLKQNGEIVEQGTTPTVKR